MRKDFLKEIFRRKKEDKKEKIEEKTTSKKWLKIFLAIFLFFVLMPSFSVLAFEYTFKDKVYEGIKIGDINLSGKTKEELQVFFDEEVKKINHEGITFFYQNKKTTVTPIVASTADPDLSRSLFVLSADETTFKIINLGRDSDFFANLKNQLKYLIAGEDVSLSYKINSKEEIEKILKENFSYLEKPAKDARLEITSSEAGVEIDIEKEEEGRVFSYEKAIKSAFSQIVELKNEPIELEFIIEKPKIFKKDIAEGKERAESVLKICSLIASEGNKNWTIDKTMIKDWIEFQPSVFPSVTVGFNKEKVEEFLKTLTEEINIKAQNAKFRIEDGKVREFQIHQGGKELNIEASYAVINNFILNLDEEKIKKTCVSGGDNAEKEIQLIVDVTAPQVPISSVNNLGIEELVGEGKSNFSGSPVNRRHNIKTGATALNGLIIAPGEEFSVNKALGEINDQTGYLPELVIKGNKTIPEYGGGLCQIATTTFRLALNAGLPITERQPHSYRVSYYEPAGADATIYSPHPDLKFINDTPAYLLLQTKISGDELTFEFWGTSDGRKVEMTEPRIFNFVSPGPTKIIETEDLAPGEKKCTERAHTGADAEFTRTITPKVGEVKTEIWKSHYVPWSAVCLLGKELPVSEPKPDVLPPNIPIDPMLVQ
jgi:vancomycin resistance protein YoaR